MLTFGLDNTAQPGQRQLGPGEFDCDSDRRLGRRLRTRRLLLITRGTGAWNIQRMITYVDGVVCSVFNDDKRLWVAATSRPHHGFVGSRREGTCPKAVHVRGRMFRRGTNSSDGRRRRHNGANGRCALTAVQSDTGIFCPTDRFESSLPLQIAEKRTHSSRGIRLKHMVR